MGAATYAALAVGGILAAHATVGGGATSTDVPFHDNGFVVCLIASAMAAYVAWSVNAQRTQIFTVPQDDTQRLCRSTSPRVRATAILAVGADMYSSTPHD